LSTEPRALAKACDGCRVLKSPICMGSDNPSGLAQKFRQNPSGIGGVLVRSPVGMGLFRGCIGRLVQCLPWLATAGNRLSNKFYKMMAVSKQTSPAPIQFGGVISQRSEKAREIHGLTGTMCSTCVRAGASWVTI
jgi:hypothetical protein